MISIPYFHRFLESRLSSLPTRKKKVILLFGARQTGKSTLLRKLTEGPGAFFLNLQDRRLRRRYVMETGLLIRELDAADRIQTVIVDEIQKVPALVEDVQFLYDRDPNRFQFILMGSSARRLRRGTANLLPGRAIHHVLSPFLQAESRASAIFPDSIQKTPKPGIEHSRHTRICTSRTRFDRKTSPET
jgi:predicted AAA+ superfamily ATPase